MFARVIWLRSAVIWALAISSCARSCSSVVPAKGFVVPVVRAGVGIPGSVVPRFGVSPVLGGALAGDGADASAGRAGRIGVCGAVVVCSLSDIFL